jgi:hypothetical protein
MGNNNERKAIDATISFTAAATATTTTIGHLPVGAIPVKLDVYSVVAHDNGTSATGTVGIGAFGSTSADVDYFEAAIDLKSAAGTITTTDLKMGAVVSSTDSVPITFTNTTLGTVGTAGTTNVQLVYIQP